MVGLMEICPCMIVLPTRSRRLCFSTDPWFVKVEPARLHTSRARQKTSHVCEPVSSLCLCRRRCPPVRSIRRLLGYTSLGIAAALVQRHARRRYVGDGAVHFVAFGRLPGRPCRRGR